MVHIGGCNAGCHHDLCGCSVPVHTCSRCGHSDYGNNQEAEQIRAACAERYGPPTERFGDAIMSHGESGEEPKTDL